MDEEALDQGHAGRLLIPDNFKAAVAKAAAAFCFQDEKPIRNGGVHPLVMKLYRNAVILSLSLLPLVAVGATADFSKIPKRNIFGLLSPKVEKPPEVRPELPQITLQGVTTLLNSRQALLKVQSKINSAATELCCILGEGQERDGVRVLRVEMESGTVWLTNQGTEQVLSLKRRALFRSNVNDQAY